MHDRKLTVCVDRAGPEMTNEPVKETSTSEQPPMPHEAARRDILARLVLAATEVAQVSPERVAETDGSDPAVSGDRGLPSARISEPARELLPSVPAAPLPLGRQGADEEPCEVGSEPLSQGQSEGEAVSEPEPVLPAEPVENTGEGQVQEAPATEVDTAPVSSEPVLPASAANVETGPEPAAEMSAQLEAQALQRSAAPMSRSYYAGPTAGAMDAPVSSQLQRETRTEPTKLRKITRIIGRLARYMMLALVAWYVVMVVLVAVLGFVNPPTSALMLIRAAQGVDIDQRWVPLNKISPKLVHAVIVSEDGRFCRHWGIDPREILAAIRRANGGTPRGASTMTMQLAKNMFLWPQQSYVRKALEVPLTLTIDALWSKARIAEIYLNIVEWGPGIFGAEAAARRHFDRSAEKLTTRQAALLAVSLPSPIRRKPGSPSRLMNKMASTIIARMRTMSNADACVTEAR
ncbi:monofunctional biosynthetic peptidoglycan transglycosylase [Filomicrobium insigne]|uniref:Biosynthetic peptidoglycan transglycosylase n=1 Tax=Filomicrobium insigne TaxID=418854 RepID=A0A1H0HZ71_9HYPH|nr:monofunctional biosynthetic peptidoglycan transglycosylase [Filomicrobium insigne]SDO24467.1 monofunctional biosynthetic peptidoglycan transglycosylase [Filomicrobium insigne]